MGGGGGDGGAYVASQTIVLHMKRLNQTESPNFVILCVLCFQRQCYVIVLHKMPISIGCHCINNKSSSQKSFWDEAESFKKF